MVGPETAALQSGERRTDPASLYLDLMKRTLSFALWDEPGLPIEVVDVVRSPLRRALYTALARLFGRAGLRILRRNRASEGARHSGEVYPMLAHTMIGMQRLDNLQACIEGALADDVPGDLIETGVWRGGACILMRAVLAAHGVADRRVFLADSFAGLPPPDAETYPHDRGDRHHERDIFVVSRAEVEESFRRYGLLDEQVVFLEGWFRDTLPKAPIEALAVMRLDGDMYQSTREALESLYPRLSPGGYCIIDDYAIPSCRKAVEDYRREHGIQEPTQGIDRSSCFWRKA